MKKRLLWITSFFIIGAVIVYIITIPKVEKWSYSLPNNYLIKKTSSTKVVLGKEINKEFLTERDGEKLGIEEYIAEFAYGNRYIALKCAVSTEDSVIVKFYIVDTQEEDIYGPYYDDETYQEVEKRMIEEELGNWIETSNMPEEAKKD